MCVCVYVSGVVCVCCSVCIHLCVLYSVCMCGVACMYVYVCVCLFAVADLDGAHPVCAPPTTQNFLDFMQFFGNFDKIVCWRPPRGSAPPPTGNPGSAPGLCVLVCVCVYILTR